MSGLRVNFNEPSTQSKVHFKDCTKGQDATGTHTLWLEDVPVPVAREWVLYGELPPDLDARVAAHFGHNSERYREYVKACRHCRPL